MNRVDQIYESEFSITMVLIDGNDRLNLNTPAEAWGANGPCGAAPCYDEADVSTCTGDLLYKSRDGRRPDHRRRATTTSGTWCSATTAAASPASASSAAREGAAAAPACREPDGDFFAVDYVAHEMGHQFGGNHTFNGNERDCGGGNRNGPTSVEPGSGSSIMAYAGICEQDDLQPHSDPYFSERSFSRDRRATSPPTSLRSNEVQNVSLIGLRHGRRLVHAVVQRRRLGADRARRELHAAGHRGRHRGDPGLARRGDGDRSPRSAYLTRTAPFGDVGFSVTFGGTLAGIDVPQLGAHQPERRRAASSATACRAARRSNHGFTVTPDRQPRAGRDAAKRRRTRSRTARRSRSRAAPPTPTATPSPTCGSRTTSAATAARAWSTTTRRTGRCSGSSARGSTPRSTTRTPRRRPARTRSTTDPTRVFPDMAQILADNTNAETGKCPAAPPRPQPVPLDVVDCYSEFLPTQVYDGPMHFRLTARDGKGGVAQRRHQGRARAEHRPVPGHLAERRRVARAGLDPDGDLEGRRHRASAPINATTVDVLLSTDGGVTLDGARARRAEHGLGRGRAAERDDARPRGSR